MSQPTPVHNRTGKSQWRFHTALLALLGLSVLVLTTLQGERAVVEPFSSPHAAWLPLLTMQYVIPDKRFGIAEHSLAEMKLLGFPNDGRFHARQWPRQEEDSPVVFLRPAHRSRKSNWCQGAYRFQGMPDLCARPLFLTLTATEDGWFDEEGLCLWMQTHPGKSYIVGNEEAGPDPVGDGLTPSQYTRWYRDAYALVRQCDPTAKIGSYGPASYHTREHLASVWTEFEMITGVQMPVDFFPIHHYPRPGFELANEIAALERWIGWLDAQNGQRWRWTGARAYWLTEFGLPSWSVPCPTEESLRLMDELIPWLKANDLGIVLWAWWPSGNKKLFPENTLLIENGTPTELGIRYHQLAVE